MTRTYDPIFFAVTAQAAVSPVDGAPAVQGRIIYQDGQPYGIQFKSAVGDLWDVAFANIPWIDARFGIGAVVHDAMRTFRLALRVLGARLPAIDPITPFAIPTPPGLAPADPTLLSAYLNTQLRPFLAALATETARTANAVITVINVLLQLMQDPER